MCVLQVYAYLQKSVTITMTVCVVRFSTAQIAIYFVLLTAAPTETVTVKGHVCVTQIITAHSVTNYVLQTSANHQNSVM